jgi:hypothetical protein
MVVDIGLREIVKIIDISFSKRILGGFLGLNAHWRID